MLDWLYTALITDRTAIIRLFALFFVIELIPTTALGDASVTFEPLEKSEVVCGRDQTATRLVLAPEEIAVHPRNGIEKLGIGFRRVVTRRGSDIAQESFYGPETTFWSGAVSITISAEFDVCAHPSHLDILDGNISLEAQAGDYSLSMLLSVEEIIESDTDLALYIVSRTTLRGQPSERDGNVYYWPARIDQPQFLLHLSGVELVFAPEDPAGEVVPITLDLDGQWPLRPNPAD